jgi:hypothetical protein
MRWSTDFDQAGALARWIPTSLRSVSGAIRQYTFREVVAATLRNRFRYMLITASRASLIGLMANSPFDIPRLALRVSHVCRQKPLMLWSNSTQCSVRNDAEYLEMNRCLGCAMTIFVSLASSPTKDNPDARLEQGESVLATTKGLPEPCCSDLCRHSIGHPLSAALGH